MNKKEKYNKDETVTVTMSGRDSTKFWVAVESETSEWTHKGYKMVHMQKGGSTFQDGALTSLLNMVKTVIGMQAKHDPVVIMTFVKESY